MRASERIKGLLLLPAEMLTIPSSESMEMDHRMQIEKRERGKKGVSFFLCAPFCSSSSSAVSGRGVGFVLCLSRLRRFRMCVMRRECWFLGDLD